MEKPGLDLLDLIYQQPVYKQLALAWQIVKQLSGLNPLSLTNNKNNILKKNGVFLCNKRKITTKPIIHQNSAVSKTFFEKFLKSLIINVDFESWKITVFLADIGYLVKLLSNH